MTRGVVVALHSLFFDGSMFDDVKEQLPEYDFVTPDHLGQGVRAGEAGTPSLPRLAADVIATVENLGVDSVHLVGSSMGAYVAVIAAATEPHLFKTCTLSAASGDAELRPEHFDKLVTDLRTLGPAQMVDSIAYTMFGDSFLGSGAPELDRWKDHFASLDRSVAIAAEQVFSRSELWPYIDQLDLPLFLLAGKEDHAKPAEHMARIAKRRPGSFLTVVPDAGHTPFVECPRTVAPILELAFSSSGRSLGKERL